MIKTNMKLELIHGFSNKTRLEILETIKNGEKTVTEIIDALEVNQSSISQHLACLRGCGLIVSRQEGKYVYYRLRNEKIVGLLSMFDEVLEDVEDDMSTCESHIG